MPKFLLLLLFPLLMGSFRIAAQKPDSLWVSEREGEWVLLHKVKKGETLFLLSRRYHVPPAILADANHLTYQDGLKDQSQLVVPLGAYNRQNSKTANNGDLRALYYRADRDDDLYHVSHLAGVNQKTLQSWNRMTDNHIRPGQVLMVGWLLYDATQLPSSVPPAMPVTTPPARPETKPVSATPVARPGMEAVRPDTMIILKEGADKNDTLVSTPVHEISSIEQLYLDQTANEAKVVTEKGAAAFFNMGSAAPQGVYYAFHNSASKGSVIKVHNPGTGKTIFVKVLGPLPGTRQYANALIGISSTAKAALGVRDTRAWCVLSYAGY